jgi:hypothetical protein
VQALIISQRSEGAQLGLAAQVEQSSSAALQAAVQFVVSAASAVQIAVAQLANASTSVSAAISVDRLIGASMDAVLLAMQSQAISISLRVLEVGAPVRAPSGAGYSRISEGSRSAMSAESRSRFDNTRRS